MKILYTGANGLLGQKISAATPQYSNHAFLATARGENRTKNLGTASYASMDIQIGRGLKMFFQNSVRM